MRRIGIDVGGTNTDGAILDGEQVIETIKTPTTTDVLGGIRNVLDGLSHQDIDAVVIGTTQFTNAVVQRSNLNRVGFLRIGLPAGRSLPPLSGWPSDLAEAVRSDTFLVRGGIEYDGRPFEELDEQAVIDDACVPPPPRFDFEAKLKPLNVIKYVTAEKKQKGVLEPAVVDTLLDVTEEVARKIEEMNAAARQSAQSCAATPVSYTHLTLPTKA